MTALDRDALATWLDRYGRAWEGMDPDAAAGLFTDDSEYVETPYSEPMRGPDAVREYWVGATSTQRDVAFRHEVLAADPDAGRGIAWWRAEFTSTATGGPVVLDGIFVLDFADDGRCRRLREWWHLDQPGKDG